MKLLNKNFAGLLLSVGTLNASSAFAQTDNAGRWFIDASLGTSFYNYSETDLRDELPASTLTFFNDSDLDDDDSDIVNGNIGVGYYFSDDFSVTARYTSGIEYGFLSGLFTDVNFDSELSMAEIDATYNLFQLSDSFDVYVSGAVVYTMLETDVFERQDDNERTRVNSHDTNEVNIKLGTGLMWQFGENWAIKAGYERYNYMSLDKFHITWQYQF